ncbi:unnamed protein product [Ceratitis capitata]|uniref:(Mediterranean fruit fly) hypothetical protein n=1 Tax=Ceratitis capitata TaxID=7213 RepID=A0A811UBE6_CERCA|nr:unnamed protein product [Ceratitis capitata]
MGLRAIIGINRANRYKANIQDRALWSISKNDDSDNDVDSVESNVMPDIEGSSFGGIGNPFKVV